MLEIRNGLQEDPPETKPNPYENDRVAFVRDVLGVDEIAPYQVDILRMFDSGIYRVAVRGPHGLGKTTLAAWLVLHAVTCLPGDVKVPCTASKWRQLTKFLFPEIRKWARKADWSKLPNQFVWGKHILELNIKFEDKEAFALASNDASAIEGAHAGTIFYVFDEAKAIPVDIWDAAEGAFSTAGSDTGDKAYALAISTPGPTSGRFYDIHTRKPGFEEWTVRHVKIEEAIKAGRISQEWVNARKRQWGEQSGVYKNRVLGEFDDSGEDNVIPLQWVELANDRWREWKDNPPLPDEFVSVPEFTLGVDPARYGQDQTTRAKYCKGVIEWLKYTSKESTMQTVGRVINDLLENGGGKSTPIAVDVIGVGAGVVDRLEEQGYNVLGVNVSTASDMTDESGEIRFVNTRSAIWWMLRDALNPENLDPIALPPDDLLTGDLTAPTFEYTSAGKIKVESKDDLRERIGRSTDSADAVGLAVYRARKPAGVFIY